MRISDLIKSLKSLTFRQLENYSIRKLVDWSCHKIINGKQTYGYQNPMSSNFANRHRQGFGVQEASPGQE
jgi:hypothetical protein